MGMLNASSFARRPLHRRLRAALLPSYHPPRRIVRRRLIIRMHRVKEFNQRRRLCRRQRASICRHISATQQDLPNHLVLRQPRRHIVQAPARAAHPLHPAHGSCGTAFPGDQLRPAAPAANGYAAILGTGTAAPLQASICGLHGVYVPRCVNTPKSHRDKHHGKHRYRPRHQLFSPTPATNGSAIRIATPPSAQLI